MFNNEKNVLFSVTQLEALVSTLQAKFSTLFLLSHLDPLLLLFTFKASSTEVVQSLFKLYLNVYNTFQYFHS